ncbi:unnamed protein product [Musa banksii]
MARAGGMTNAVNVGIAVQADWENREFIANISLNIRRLFDFLLQFGPSLSLSLGVVNSSSFCWICFEMLILSLMPHTLGSRSCNPSATTKGKLAALNEKLDVLEHRLQVLEVQVSSVTTNPSVFN